MSAYDTNCDKDTSYDEDVSKYMLDDLQLAAELGKTLLERNKELETALKHHQNIIDDQAQEIEYLQKQTAALREVNDSRLRIYEQLEVGIQELERANHRLIAENSADKKQIKSLQLNIENLETKCEELCKNLEDTKKSLVAEKRKTDKLLQERANNSSNDGNRTTYGILHSSTINDSQHYFDEDKTPNKNEQKQNKESNEMNRSENDDNFIDESTIIDSTGIIDEDQLLSNKEDTEMIRILTELETTKKAFLSEQQRVTELEEQLVTIIQENQSLQSRLAQTGSSEEMRSVHDELSILEEVRQGTMCSRCLRSVNDKSIADDNLSMTLESDGEIDIGVVSGNVGGGVENISETLLENKSIKNNKNTIKPTTLDLNQTLSLTNNVNPYRQLVEKYEALLEVHKHSTNRNLNRKQQQHQQQQHQQQQNTFLSDDGGQTSSEFSSINVKESLEDELNACNADKQENDINKNNNNTTTKNSTITTRTSKKNNNNKLSRRTPTDLSETETLSSGFSDEICHKYTQTDERQGYFLCSIGDGEDCKFSIYDDVSPIDSRFRNRPEYRALFKEIFAVLKKAAENKEEGESLPLLDDNCPNSKVPPVTPANEDPPSFCDDTQSVISSAFSEQSVAISECVTKIERKTAKKHLKTQDKSQLRTSSCSFQAINTPTNTSSNLQQINENGKILTPLKREPLEYVQVGVGVRKKNRRKHRNSSFELSESPILPSPPKVYFGSGKKRKDFRPYIPNLIQNQPQQQQQQQQSSFMPKTHQEWSGHSMIIYNRNMQSQSSPSQSFLCGSAGGGVVGDLNSKLTTNTPLNTMSNFEYKPSTVSQDLHKLKKLDLSYAEVLRRADACKHHHRK